MAVPFLLTAAGVQFLQNSFGFIRRHYDAIQLAPGIVPVAIGVLVLSGEFFRLNALARSFVDSTRLNLLEFLWRM